MPARACPKCKALMDVPADLLHRAVECPTCANTFTPHGPKMATVLAAKPSKPVVATVASPRRRRDDEPVRRRPPRREESGNGGKIAAIFGGTAATLFVIALIGLKIYLRSSRDQTATDASTESPRVGNVSPPAPVGTPNPPPVSASEWQRVPFCEGTISVEFPGASTRSTLTTSPDGSRTRTDSVAFTSPDRTKVFTCTSEVLTSLSDFSATPNDPFPQSGAPALAARLGGTLARTAAVSHGLGTGREYDVTLANGSVTTVRMLAFDAATRPRVVTLTAGGTGVTAADKGRFFSSLQVSTAPALPSPTTPPVKPPVAVTPPKPKGELPDGWERYEFPDKSASVGMPGTPAAKEVDVAPGIRTVAAEYAANKGALTYSISYTAEPSDPRGGLTNSAYIQRARSSLETAFGRKPDRETPVVLPGRIGRELEFRNKDGQGVRVRYFKVVKGNETRVFAITLTGELPEATRRDPFADSFKIDW